MKKHPYLFSVLGVCIAAALLFTGFLLNSKCGDIFTGIMSGLSAVLLVVCGTALLAIHKYKALTPEERRDEEVAETDERNVAIREKAAMDSWYCTEIMLFVMGIIARIAGLGKGAEGLIVAALLLHIIIYLINIARWNKKL